MLTIWNINGIIKQHIIINIAYMANYHHYSYPLHMHTSQLSMEINTARLHPMIMIIIISQQCAACRIATYFFFYCVFLYSVVFCLLFACNSTLRHFILAVLDGLLTFSFVFSLFRLFGVGNSIEATSEPVSSFRYSNKQIVGPSEHANFFKMSFFTLYKFCFYLFSFCRMYVCSM